jgi:hypothetical protein
VGYMIIGTGPSVPVLFEVKVKTAAEAQLKLRPARELCGHAVIRDGVGREISEVELGVLVRQEREAELRQVQRKIR